MCITVYRQKHVYQRLSAFVTDINQRVRNYTIMWGFNYKRENMSSIVSVLCMLAVVYVAMDRVQPPKNYHQG